MLASGWLMGITGFDRPCPHRVQRTGKPLRHELGGEVFVVVKQRLCAIATLEPPAEFLTAG